MAETDHEMIKPHAIMVEYLFQGHINASVNLAIGLASKGCTVTYIQTDFIHHQTCTANPNHESPFSAARASGLDIRHTTVSDGFPLDFDRDLNLEQYLESIERDFAGSVEELVGRIVKSEIGRSSPFLIADCHYLWMPDVAAKYNMVYVSFWPSSAQLLSVGHHLALLQEKGISLSCAYDNYKDHMQEIAGTKSVSSMKDFIKYAPRKEDPLVPEFLSDTIMKAQLEVRRAHFILCHTVEDLEPETISILNKKQQLPTYAIGPTNFFSKTSVSSSLISEVDCNEWLSSKPPSSVLLIAYGSIAQTDKHIINELAHGLRSSRANFLWVLRSDAVTTEGGEENNLLPPGFEDDIAGRGLIVPWCKQREVLANPAIGGFLTHCGWNSIFESIWFGVPMICYPIFVDQPTHRNLLVHDWKIGINLCDNDQIRRDEVMEKIDALMVGGNEVGDKLRIEMKKVSKVVHNALAQNGSSHANLDRFLTDLKDKICMLGK